MKKLFTLLMVASFFAATAQVNPGIKLAIDGSYITVASMGFGDTLDLDKPICGDIVPVLSKGSTVPPYPAGQVATAITQAQGCDEILNAADLKGKIALIRRGICSFKLKTLAAQEAGAIAVIVYMVTADAPFAGANDATILDEITIPSVMITMADGNAILDNIKAGKKVPACLELPSRTTTLYAHVQGSTPFLHKDTIYPRIEFSNRSGKNEVGKKMYVEITNPKGVKTLLETSVDINSSTDSISIIPIGAYYPSEKGKYAIRAFGQYTPKDTLKSSISITPNSFGLDDDSFINSGAGLSSTPAGFGSEGHEWHHISYFFTGATADKATFASFGVANGAALKAKNREVEVSLIKIDENLMGAAGLDISKVRTLGEIGDLVGDVTTYQFKGTETVDKLITVPIKDGTKGITLEPNTIYALDLYYTSAPKNDSLMPAFTGYLETPIRVAGFPILGAAIMTANNYYNSGWSGASQALLRLHTDGFILGEKDLTILKENEVSFFPNPTSSVINVKLALTEQAKYVKLGIMDFSGRVLATQDLNVNEGTIPVDISNYPAGVYFFTVKTDKAFSTEKIIKN